MVNQEIVSFRRLRVVRSAGRFVVDVLAAVATLPLALLLRFDSSLPPELAAVLPQMLLLAGGVHAVAALAFGGHRRLWRYTSFREYLQLAGATMAGTLLLLVIVLVLRIPVPTTVVLMHGALLLLSFAGLRVLRRVQMMRERRRKDGVARQKALIVGAGDTASALLRDWEMHLRPKWDFVGLLDDSPLKRGLRLGGLSVLGPTTELEYVIRREGIKQVVVAMPSADKAVIRGIIGRAQAAGAAVQAVPRLEVLLRGDRGRSAPLPITLEHLMDSAEVKRTLLESVRRPRENELVLVTGGAGYIGSHLVRRLLEAGTRVRVLDNFTYGREALEPYLADGRLEVVRGDISSIRAVVGAVKNVDTIIALAAIVGDPACGINAEETLNLNYEATKVLVEAANFYGVRRLVFASSCSVYGAADNELLTESSVLTPVSLYARTRILSEDVLFDRCGDVEPVVLRLSTVYGLSQRMRFDLVVNAMTARASVQRRIQVFGGDQWRPFVHCDDAANAFLLAAKAPSENVKGEIFNVGSNSMNFTIAEVADIVAREVGDDVVVEHMETTDDRRNYRVAFDKVRDRLGFQAAYDLPRGVREMAEAIGTQAELRNFEDVAYSNLKALRLRLDAGETDTVVPGRVSGVR